MSASLYRISALILLLPFALPAVVRSATLEEFDANRRISNSILSVGTSATYAGAVCSIIYDGVELVNNYDHGRQMQVAWTYNALGEAYNPTEAGSAADFQQATTTSQLLATWVVGNTLNMESRPSYWNRPRLGGNTKLVTNDILKKTMALDYRGDPHVIAFDTEISLSPQLTGPPILLLRIEAPTLYAVPELCLHYCLNLENGKCIFVAPDANLVKNQLNERIRRDTDRQSIPILSSPDGRHAIGFYALTAEGFWSYYTWDVPSDIPHFACNKITTFFENAASVGHVYRYRTLVIIGSLEIVKTRAVKLWKQSL